MKTRHCLLRIKIIMASNREGGKVSLSLGRECAAYGCSSRDYYFQHNEKKPTMERGSDGKRKKIWCNLIKRKDGMDGFKVSKSTRLCEKHFEPGMVYRPPGGTKKRLLPDAKPTLHVWNNFSVPSRKEPTFRPSPRKRCRESSITTFATADGSNESTSGLHNIESSEFDKLKAELRKLKHENSLLKQNELQLTETCNNNTKKIEHLENEMKNNSVRNEFMIHVLKSDESCNYYTGFPTLEVFQAVLDFLNAGPDGENVVLYNYREGKNDERGRKRCFSPLESYVLTLIKLRRNFGTTHLSYLFNASEGTISNTINTWINFMYIRLGSICIWPTREQIQKVMPESMKRQFPTTRCIIDCVEFKVEVPTSLRLHKTMYSEYKSHTTVKVLVGIAPGGGFSFISSAYPGSISDKNIVIKSGFLCPELWEKGDSVMADRGFTIAEYLQPLNVDLIIPSFLLHREQFTERELVTSQQIARERIHVERMIQHLKCYHIFDQVVPLNMVGSLNQMITVAALLANFQDPILKTP